MIHFAVQPKVTLHCKATLLQLKKKYNYFSFLLLSHLMFTWSHAEQTHCFQELSRKISLWTLFWKFRW